MLIAGPHQKNVSAQLWMESNREDTILSKITKKTFTLVQYNQKNSS